MGYQHQEFHTTTASGGEDDDEENMGTSKNLDPEGKWVGLSFGNRLRCRRPGTHATAVVSTCSQFLQGSCAKRARRATTAGASLAGARADAAAASDAGAATTDAHADAEDADDADAHADLDGSAGADADASKGEEGCCVAVGTDVVSVGVPSQKGEQKGIAALAMADFPGAEDDYIALD